MADNVKPGNSSGKGFVAKRILTGVGLFGAGVLATVGFYESGNIADYIADYLIVGNMFESSGPSKEIAVAPPQTGTEVVNGPAEIKTMYEDVVSEPSAKPQTFYSLEERTNTADVKASPSASSTPNVSVADLPSRNEVLKGYFASTYFKSLLDDNNLLVLDKSMKHDMKSLTDLALSNFDSYVSDTFSAPLTADYMNETYNVVRKALAAKVAKEQYASGKFYAVNHDTIVDRETTKPVDTVTLKFK